MSRKKFKVGDKVTITKIVHGKTIPQFLENVGKSGVIIDIILDKHENLPIVIAFDKDNHFSCSSGELQKDNSDLIKKWMGV